jgi:hypothetical protein
MGSRWSIAAGAAALLLQVTTIIATRAQGPATGVVPVTAPPASLGLDPFYTKYVSAHGLPVVGSANVSDHALREAAFLIDQLLDHRPEIRDAMNKSKMRVAVMAYSERTTELPEHRNLKPKEYVGLLVEAGRPADGLSIRRPRRSGRRSISLSLPRSR